MSCARSNFHRRRGGKHAFHVHQLHIRVLKIDDATIDQPPLLDVVTVPDASATGYHSKQGPVRPGRVVIKLTFPPSLAGDIPFHCHLADHEDNGMMAVLCVLGPAPATAGARRFQDPPVSGIMTKSCTTSRSMSQAIPGW
ncbi:MAG: multicopper oxidase domain-containing protein [Steroidobacteraceae bacterium]